MAKENIYFSLLRNTAFQKSWRTSSQTHKLITLIICEVPNFLCNSSLILYYLYENTGKWYSSRSTRGAKLLSNMESSWLSQLPNLHKVMFYFPNCGQVKLILTKVVKSQETGFINSTLDVLIFYAILILGLLFSSVSLS